MNQCVVVCVLLKKSKFASFTNIRASVFGGIVANFIIVDDL